MNHILSIADQLMCRARRLIRSRQHAAALQPLQRLEDMALPAHDAGRVQQWLGVCHLRLRNRRRAARHLRAATRLRPADARAHVLLARVAGSPSEAVHNVLRAVELSPDDARCRARAGLACVRAGDHEQGLELLREAAQQAPAEFGVTRRLVLGLVEAGHPDEAERAVLAARFVSPRCSRLRGLLAQLRCAQMQPRQATDAMDNEPAVLPFLRIAGLPPRRDTAAALTGPHLMRLPRRYAFGRPG